MDSVRFVRANTSTTIRAPSSPFEIKAFACSSEVVMHQMQRAEGEADCTFLVNEGNDFHPIEQSYVIRALRAENARLKERVREAGLPLSGDEDEDVESGDGGASRAASRLLRARQRRFKTGDRIDNLYFGTPGLATIISDFANLQIGNHSLTHTMPRGRDMYTVDQPQKYPFPAVPIFLTIPSLISLLPKHNELFEYLDLFQRRAQPCSFPHLPDEVTKREIERFLADVNGNSEEYPDMLALIFATLATGLQMGLYDRCGGGWDENTIADTRKRSDIYIQASMQALRIGSFMSRPTLLGIQTLIMMGPYLTNSGRFLDAWTMFGTTFRLAHSIGLHRNPKFLDPAPPLRESNTRQTLWWWMLHMDQQYSVTLGRPLGISGFGDCPPPQPLTTNQAVLRMGEFVNHFTILARQVVSSDGLTNVARIDEFTDKLIGLWDTMPEALQFNESWVRIDTTLPEWPLDAISASLFAKVHSLLILLNRQRIEKTQSAASSHASPSAMPSSSFAQPPAPSVSSEKYPQSLHPSPVRGRTLVINSSVQILQAFLFFHYRNPAALICWSLGQQAFNACMILILDMWETYIKSEGEYDEAPNCWLVHQAYYVFTELQRHGVHQLAELAVQRISDGLAQLEDRKNQKQINTAAASRRASHAHAQASAQLVLDTASMADWSRDTVMGNTGMYLLEDNGLQSFQSPAFQPLGWQMTNSAHPSSASPQRSPQLQSPIVPVSQVAAAPFPVMSPPFSHSYAGVPVSSSGFAINPQSNPHPGAMYHQAQRQGLAQLPQLQSQPSFQAHQASHSPLQAVSQAPAFQQRHAAKGSRVTKRSHQRRKWHA